MFRVILGSVVLASFAGLSSAQERLPLPPTPPPTDYRAFDRLENFDEFLRAYKSSGSPRLGFRCDMLGLDGGAAATLNDVGRLSGLGGRIEEYFRSPETIIVNLAATDALNAQQAEALRRNDEASAARILGQKANVDVMVYVRLIQQPGRRDGAAYSGRYVVADLRRGTTIGQHSWDMYTDARDGEFTAPVMGEYARAIARRIAAQYAEAFPEGGTLAGMRRFTLRLVGDYEDEDLSQLRDVLRTSPGVKSDSVMLREEGVANGRGMPEFELMYAGDLIDLRRVARRAAINALGMEAEVIDSREGQLDLKLAPLSLTSKERDLSGGPENGRNREARQAFARAYQKAGRPTIAVLINKAAVTEEESLVKEPEASAATPAQSGDGTNIILGDRVSVNGGVYQRDLLLDKIIDRELRDRRAERREDQTIDTRVFEDKILARLVELGVTPKDISSAQTALGADAEFKSRAWTDRDLAFTLGKQAGADIVISGVGKLVRSRGDASPVRVVFTMRAFQVKDGNILSAATVQRDLRADQSLNQAVEELSAEAVGKMATQMGKKWEEAN